MITVNNIIKLYNKTYIIKGEQLETALARERGLLRTSEHALTDKETARMALVTECEYVFL